jgi:hypothetical protein
MKKNTGNKKANITEDMERLKQRREERKNKNFSNDPKSDNAQISNSVKLVDPEYEKQIKKKKIAFDQEPEQVNKLKIF